MLALVRQIQRSLTCLHQHLPPRPLQTAAGPHPPGRRRSKHAANMLLKKVDEKSEWWVVDGEMHEIGETVPPRERFVIPRDNLPNRRRKQLRQQFMRRTRLVLKESIIDLPTGKKPIGCSWIYKVQCKPDNTIDKYKTWLVAEGYSQIKEHEPWCKRYMELYNELRENWERLYWDEGYSKKLAQDHANYDSAEDDDEDFNPYRRTPQRPEHMRGDGIGKNRQGDTWEKVSLIRDKFEYDRERRMQEKAFAPMTGGHRFVMDDSVSPHQPFDPQKYISGSDDE